MRMTGGGVRVIVVIRGRRGGVWAGERERERVA